MWKKTSTPGLTDEGTDGDGHAHRSTSMRGTQIDGHARRSTSVRGTQIGSSARTDAIQWLRSTPHDGAAQVFMIIYDNRAD